MTLSEAAVQMRQGKCVRRATWKSGRYISGNEGFTYFHREGEKCSETRFWNPGLNDLAATDWEGGDRDEVWEMRDHLG